MLIPLAADDIAEVMRIERLPGYEGFVGSWPAEEHEAERTSPDARYLGLRDREGLAGFVIFQKVGEPVIRLRRIAVDATDKGTGTRILRAALDWAFETFPAEAVTLGVARANDRARHIYQREGFVDDGEDEVHFNMVLTRRAWARSRPGAQSKS
jgi:RimJ/RimL family protein N-acetyltransferase